MKNKYQINLKYLSFVLVLFATLFSFQANALQMNPLSVVLKPSGGGAKQSFRVTNESNKPIAVQFSVTTRQQINNKEIRKPADENFMIYPPQTIIPARTTQKVRIEWLGAGNIPKEEAYRIIVEQVHVSLDDKEKTGITMLMTLVNGLYVQPNGTKSILQVKGVQQQGNKLAVTITNSGTKHQIIDYPTLVLRNGAKVIKLKGNTMKGINGNNLLAGATVRFYIPLPKGFINGAWKGTIQYPR